MQKAGYKNSTVNIKDGGFFDFSGPVASADRPPSKPFFLFGNPTVKPIQVVKPVKPAKLFKVDTKTGKKNKKAKSIFANYGQSAS
jgi:hypothetical protein